jgi:hypothetical protein
VRDATRLYQYIQKRDEMTNNEGMAGEDGTKIVAAGPPVPRHLRGLERWYTV